MSYFLKYICIYRRHFCFQFFGGFETQYYGTHKSNNIIICPVKYFKFNDSKNMFLIMIAPAWLLTNTKKKMLLKFYTRF